MSLSSVWCKMKQLIFSRSKKDFRVDTFRCGGPGGQNQNKRDTGVRITDKETGLNAESREHRTQEQNKKAAFRKLVDKLVNHYVKKPEKERFTCSLKTTRTYNEAEDRVTDHETGEKFSYRHTIGKGDMTDLIMSRFKRLSK